MISPTLATRLFSLFESKPVLGTFAKEIGGINTPRIAMAQTKDELVDTSVSELGNTAGLFVGGWGTERVVEGLLKGAGRTGPWAKLGSTLAIYSGVFSIMWAMPFIRNYVTAKRTGKTDFSAIIDKHRAQDQESKSAVDPIIAEYRRKALTILGIGGAGILAGTLLGFAMKNPELPRWLNTLHNGNGKNGFGWRLLGLKNGLGLKDKGFNDFTEMKAVLFWGVPAYAGWIQASRGQIELKEWLLKFGVFVGGFWAVPKLIGGLFNKKLAEHFSPLTQKLGEAAEFKYGSLAKLSEISAEAAKKAQRLLNIREFTKLGISIFVLGAGAQLLNIFLRRQRLHQVQTLQASVSNAQASPSNVSRQPAFQSLQANPFRVPVQTPSFSPTLRVNPIPTMMPVWKVPSFQIQ